MIWLSIVVGSLIGVSFGCIFYYLIEKKKIRKLTAYCLTFTATLLTLLGMQFYGAQHYLAYVFESKIKSEDPVFALLAEKSPIEFNQYIARIKTNFVEDNGNKVPYYTGEYIYSQLKKYSPHAATQSFYDLAKATIALYSKIFAKDPGMVLTVEFNLQTVEPLDFKALGKTYNDALNPVATAKIMIIENAIKNPQPLLSKSDKERAKAIIHNILAKLSINYGDNVVTATFSHPNDPTLNRKLAAEIIIQFYQMLLDRGKDDAGLVIKYIFTTSL
jgi:hypothetical protein